MNYYYLVYAPIDYRYKCSQLTVRELHTSQQQTHVCINNINYLQEHIIKFKRNILLWTAAPVRLVAAVAGELIFNLHIPVT